MILACISSILRNGFEAGDVITILEGTVKGRGKMEIAANGFLYIELHGTTRDAAIKKHTRNKLIPNPAFGATPDEPDTLIDKARDNLINYSATPIPVHPADWKSGKLYALRAGRSIERHLKNDVILTVRSVAVGVK